MAIVEGLLVNFLFYYDIRCYYNIDVRKLDFQSKAPTGNSFDRPDIDWVDMAGY